jgi:hypothetical protein
MAMMKEMKKERKVHPNKQKKTDARKHVFILVVKQQTKPSSSSTSNNKLSLALALACFFFLFLLLSLAISLLAWLAGWLLSSEVG